MASAKKHRASDNLAQPVSLLETLKAIEAGTVTKAQSLEMCLERIALYDNAIHAYCTLADRERILAEAEARSGPLSGLGFGIKDIFDTATLPTGYGSPIYADYHPGYDAPIVAMSTATGATLLGKTVTTEFAFFHPGPTTNPHNQNHTPGGSSSGSAAAIAAGMAHFAIGTQTGGSVIRPAAFCGVTGYKPSAGLLPTVGMKHFSWSMDTTGVMAATVADVAYLTSMLTGRTLRTDRTGSFSNPTLGIMRSHSWPEADPAYRQQFEALLDSLKTFGITLIDLAPSDKYIAAFHAHQIIQDFEARQSMAWDYQTHPDKLSPMLRQTLDFASTIKPSDYDDARVQAEEAGKEIDDWFEDIDAIISLSAPGPAPEGLASTGSSIFNRVWTLFGLPAINVTGLENDSGLPLGIQIIGPYMADQATLQIAHWLEAAIERHKTG